MVRRLSAVSLMALAIACGDYETLEVSGVERRFIVHRPQAAQGQLPAVLAFHGGGSSGRSMQRYAKLDNVADSHGFVVVYPDAVDGHWNDGRRADSIPEHRQDVDDVGFVSTLIDHLREAYEVDARRVYATGISNGAMMALRLACELAERIVAIAPIAGQMPASLAPICAPTRAVALLLVVGTEDAVVPYDGGEIAGTDRGSVLSAHATVQGFVAGNGCTIGPVHETQDNVEDGTSLEVATYSDCREGASVVFMTVVGGGHTWPGAQEVHVLGATSRELDASQEAWEFFARHVR